MITRLLLLIAIGVIVYLLLRRWLVRRESRHEAPPYKPMVSCTRCGLHLPRESAIERDGCYFCCREHAESSAR